MKKSRADFCYRVGVFEGKTTLLIWDENRGKMSVTNDIENVVKDIVKDILINPNLFVIIYRDSEGRWDGWDAVTEEFYPLVRFFKVSSDILWDEYFTQLKPFPYD